MTIISVTIWDDQVLVVGAKMLTDTGMPGLQVVTALVLETDSLIVESGDVWESVLGFVWISYLSGWNLNFVGKTVDGSVKMGVLGLLAVEGVPSSSDGGYYVQSLEYHSLLL